MDNQKTKYVATTTIRNVGPLAQQIKDLIAYYGGEINQSEVVRQAVTELHYRLVVMPNMADYQAFVEAQKQAKPAETEAERLQKRVDRLEAELRLKQSAIEYYKNQEGKVPV